MRLEDLPDVHPARHAERIEHDVGMDAVFEERHVLDRHDARYHALVAVTAGHLVAGLDLALHRDEDLDHLHHAGRQFVAALQLLDLVEEALFKALLRFVVLLPHRFDFSHQLVVRRSKHPPLRTRMLIQHRARALGVLLEALWPCDALAVFQELGEAAVDVAVQDRLFVVAVLGKTLDLFPLDRQSALVLVDAVPVEYADFDDGALHARRHAQRGIANVGSLFAEDGAQQLFFRRHRAFALWRDLADQDVAGAHFRADIDDAGFVEILQRFFRNVRNVAGDFLRAELGVARHHLEFLDVDRGEDVVLDDSLGEQDRIFEVVAIPRHERDQHVAAERELAEIGRGTVGNDVALGHLVADLHQRTLVDAGRLVGALVLHQPVDIDARLGGVEIVGGADHDTGGVDLVDHAGSARRDRSPRVARDHPFHAGADERRLGAHQRHGLTLHVGAHQRAVGVVVLEERDQRRGHRNQLLRRHVHIVDLIRRDHQHVAGVAADHEVVGEAVAIVERDVGLRHVITALLHRREVDHLVGDAAVLDLAIGRFDEAVFVDAGEGRQRVDQTDIGAFRGLDRADPAVMGRMHVAHLEAGALAGQTARAKRRQPALVGDFRQRVGLVHELRQLRRAEELAHRGGRRLGVDQVLRHHGVDIDAGHPLLDGALHAQQADAILVLHQLADRAHAPVAEVIDVVDFALAVAQIDQRLDDGQNVFLAQRAMGVGRIEFQAHVHLDAADRGQVVALTVEEQRLEHGLRGIDRRRFAGTHHAIDVEQRVFTRHVLVGVQRVADVGADIDVVDVEQRQFLVALLVERLQRLLGDFLAGFGVDFTGLRIDEVFGKVVADQFLIRQPQRLEALFLELAGGANGQFLAGFEHHLAAVGIDQVVDGRVAAETGGVERHAPAILGPLVADLLVEGGQDGFAVETEREHQRGHRNLAAAVDAREHDVLGVEFDIEPGAAIGNDARGKQQLAGRMGLALVVVEEHAGRTVHLRDDDALGAVDDEGAVHGQEQDVYMGDIPLMTMNGTFVVNGTERVIVSQMHRSPGVFFDHDKGKTHSSGKLLFAARVIPYRGSWLDIEFDAKDIVFARIDRRRKIPVTSLMFALGLDGETILSTFYKKISYKRAKDGWRVPFDATRFRGYSTINDLIDADSGKVVLEAGKKLTVRAARQLQEKGLKALRLSDEELVGNYLAEDLVNPKTGEIYAEAGEEITEKSLKALNEHGYKELPLLDIDHVNVGAYIRNTLAADKNMTREDALFDIYRVMRPGEPPTVDTAEAMFRSLFFDSDRYDLSAVGRVKMNMRLELDAPDTMRVLRKEDITSVIRTLVDLRDGKGEIDDIDHLGNRRVRSVGELMENQYRVGLLRMERRSE